MPKWVIETEGLTKQYGHLTAVRGLTLRIAAGEIFGLLGPNGAGKTTTILMLLGLTEPTSGSVRVAGFDPTREPIEVKRRVGYLPDNVGFYEDMTGRENLKYTAALNGITGKAAEDRIDLLLSRVGLHDAADQKAGTYSRGMRQRLGLADVLLKNPEMVILDEPTLGIDPEGVRELLQLIVALSREEQMTVLLSSHLLHQVQEICDRVGIFVKGELVAVGSIDNLAKQIMVGEDVEVELDADPFDEELQEKLGQMPEVRAIEKEGEIWVIHCGKWAKDTLHKLSRTVTQSGRTLLHLRVRNYGLDEIYRRYFEGGEVHE